MTDHRADIRRLNELAGSNVEFREFGSSTSADSAEWSLLSAVLRSSDSASAATAMEAPTPQMPHEPQGESRPMSPFPGTEQPGVTEVHVAPEPNREALSTPQHAPAAKPSFGHLFRKAAHGHEQEAPHTDLVQLLKAISRCH